MAGRPVWLCQRGVIYSCELTAEDEDEDDFGESMRVLMLSWEYPPKIVGGIARHVEEISWAIAAHGHEVHVVTCDFPGAPEEETIKGVHVHRVAPYTPTDDFFHWVHQLNNAMRDRSKALLDEWTGGKSPKRAKNGIILHPHDWLAHFSAK